MSVWIFDDERVGLDREPFVAGADTMIDMAVQLKGVPDAESGFLLVFSAGPLKHAIVTGNNGINGVKITNQIGDKAIISGNEPSEP